MANQQYDETEALKKYVWRNFPELCKPSDCLPAREEVVQLLPERLKPVFRESLEHDNLQEAVSEDDAAIFVDAVTQLETQAFHRIVDVNALEIARCPKCEKVLVNKKSRQCLHCSFDWH